MNITAPPTFSDLANGQAPGPMYRSPIFRRYTRSEWRLAYRCIRAQRFGSVGHPPASVVLLSYAMGAANASLKASIRALADMPLADIEAARDLRRRAMHALREGIAV